MSKMGKIWTIVGSVLAVVVIGAFGFCTVWTVRNWDTVYKSLDGSSVYTNEDIKRTEQETWEKAAKNEAEYQNTIAELRDLVTGLQVDNAALSDEVAALNISISANESEIRQLSIRKANLESQVASLQETKTANENTINALNSQIVTLRTQADQIPTLNSQISTLQATVNQLQSINDSNAQTISNLNTQIVGLNNQISNMSEVSQNAASQIALLNNRINELQASINYYESFISTQENSSQAVATYEVDGAVWKIEIVNKGEITLPQFTNTDTLIFNGWTVNDTLLGNTYTINANTKFVASVVHKHAVQFMTDDVVYNSQYVVENEYAIVPTAPTKTGYDFLGWSLNGVDIVSDINITAVTENVTYHAVFVKVHTVTFMNGDQVIATQSVRNGEYANADNVAVEAEGVFTGWQVNGVIVDVSNYQILSDTMFEAKLLYNIWSEMTWNGLTDFNGSAVWTDGVNYYYSVGTIQYVLNVATHTWSEMTWNGLADFNGSSVWTDGIDFYYTKYNVYTGEGTHYVLNIPTHTWSPMTWNGFNNFSSSAVWTDGVNYYCSNGSANQYVLNVATHTWSKMTWNGFTPASGSWIWSDGVNYYYSNGESNQYVLNVATHTWSKMTWNGFNKFSTGVVWTDGNSYYITGKSNTVFHYVLDISTHTWSPMTWNGLTEFYYAAGCWTDGVNIYYSVGTIQYVLNHKAA